MPAETCLCLLRMMIGGNPIRLCVQSLVLWYTWVLALLARGPHAAGQRPADCRPRWGSCYGWSLTNDPASDKAWLCCVVGGLFLVLACIR